MVLYTECCLHSGPEREACAWGTECCLHSGPEREACVWYGERPPPGEPRGRPHATNGPRVAVRHGSAARGRRLNLPGEKRSLVGWAVRRVARPWASMDNTRELGWMLA